MKVPYAPLEPRDRLYEEIVDRIQQQVSAGELHPGDQIPSERELAVQFGVSRTAVREAMRSLTERGLVEVMVGRGTFIRSLPIERVVESTLQLLRERRAGTAHAAEARALLDVEIVRLAARHRTVAQLQRLDAVMRQMSEVQHSLAALVATDAELFAELARASGNPVLEVMARAAALLHDAGRPSPLGRQSVEAMLDRRRRLLRAVEAKKPDDAAKVMAEIIGMRARRD